MGRDEFSDFERVDSIFRRALELPPDDRDSFLKRACGRDADLRARVLELLELAAGESGVLASGSGLRAGWAGTLPAVEYAVEAGERFGPWRILDQIGRGGMAVVHRAERADGAYRQDVAIKLLYRTGGSPSVESRFERERSLLARLEHPNIARLLDGGTTEDGRSYIVMEYVEGTPIDRYCDARKLSIDERLKLFLTVCDAVQFAHRQLIVHRDIKPTNILVTADGVPKLLDFGIAKLLESDEELGDLTRTGLADRMLTPQYASPEQVVGDPVSTATDVHALGLLLYELLSGHRARRIMSSRPSEVEKAVCEALPPPPSAACSGDVRVAFDGNTVSAVELAAARGVSPNRLKRELRGDLDNIVMMALRHEPERRYGTAAQMAEDVQRHLNALPVAARTESLAYRARKFFRRHATALATASVIFVVVGLLVAGFTVRLAAERDRSRVEAEKAQQVVRFLTELFEVSDPETSRGETVTARELLRRGAERFERDLAGRPLLQAEMMSLVGSIYHRLGLYEDSGTLLARSLELRQEHAGNESLEVAESELHLGQLHVSTRGYAEAERAYRRALSIRERILGPDEPAVVPALLGLATVAENLNRFDEAQELIDRALKILSERPGPDTPGIDDALTSLGILNWNRGGQTEAEEIFRRVVEMREALYPPMHPSIAAALRRYGVALQARGAYVEAEPLYRRALSVYEEVLGPWHRETALAVNSLATLYRDWGRLDDALPLARRFLEIAERAMGPRDNLTAIAMGNLATLLSEAGKPAEAEALLRHAVGLFRESPFEQNVAWAERQLAATILAEGRAEEAAELLREAVRLREDTAGVDEPGLALFWRQLAEAERALSRFEAADHALLRAEALQTGSLRPDHIELAKTRLERADLAAEMGDCASANALLEQAQPILVQRLPDDHPSRVAAEEIRNQCSDALLRPP